jgi:hypothetical protein
LYFHHPIVSLSQLGKTQSMPLAVRIVVPYVWLSCLTLFMNSMVPGAKYLYLAICHKVIDYVDMAAPIVTDTISEESKFGTRSETPSFLD